MSMLTAPTVSNQRRTQIFTAVTEKIWEKALQPTHVEAPGGLFPKHRPQAQNKIYSLKMGKFENEEQFTSCLESLALLAPM